MTFIACGINHKTAQLALREQLAFSEMHSRDFLSQLIDSQAATEALILSTCNRTDIYSRTQDLPKLMGFLDTHPQFQQLIHTPQWYCYTGQAAVSHVMRVASGVDSMIVGEPQILGQLKQALVLAKGAGSIGSYLQRLFQRVFAVTKQVRTASGIGTAPVSVAYTSVLLAKRIFANLGNARILLIGSGQTIELTALHFKNQGVKRMVIANRSLDKARKLSGQFDAHTIALEDIPIYLQQVDIVVAATGSFSPILKKDTVLQVMKITKKRRPILMLDLGVPRDIEPSMADLEDVYLYNVDQIGEIIAENLKSRNHAAEQAAAMCDAQANYFMRQLQALDAVNTICAYREKVEAVREEAIKKAVQKLKNGAAAEQTVMELAQQLTQKIMHGPSVQLNQAAFDGNNELLIAARKLFDL
jgi:glutamyl-tRNA reductase